jgi:hypothetical protein
VEVGRQDTSELRGAEAVPPTAAGRIENEHFTIEGGFGIMNVVAAQPHVTLSGDRVGEYVIEEERPDGSLVLVRDTSITAIRKRLGTRAMTAEESADFWRQYGPQMQPRDDEG